MNVSAKIRSGKSASRRSAVMAIAPPLERRRLQCYLVQIIADILTLVLAFALTGYLYDGPSGVPGSLIAAQVLAPIFLTIALYNGTYSVSSLDDVARSAALAILALSISALFVVLIAFLTKAGAQFSRLGFAIGVGAAGAGLVWSRLQMRLFIWWRCGASVINELVINDSGPTVTLPQAIHIDAEEFGLEPDLNDPDALDRVGHILTNIDRVIVSCPIERRAAWAMMLKGANVEGEVLDEQVMQLGAQGARVLGGQGMLLVSAGPLGMRERVIKRLFDTLVASLALVALGPILLAVATAIKLQDGGPILFVQRRVGRGNRFFRMYKFRSMSVAMSDGAGLVSTSRHDQRVTPVGRFIRRTSIDELPQLFNVLKGDMSIVGPRPHALGSHAGEKLFWEIDLRYWHRHSLKPGLSGLAQIRGFRGATDTERDLVDRLRSDLEYMEGWTISRDVKIILLTLKALVHDRAY